VFVARRTTGIEGAGSGRPVPRAGTLDRNGPSSEFR
jgi:hypothetical protein